jgi:hypothetical protein
MAGNTTAGGDWLVMAPIFFGLFGEGGGSWFISQKRHVCCTIVQRTGMLVLLALSLVAALSAPLVAPQKTLLHVSPPLGGTNWSLVLENRAGVQCS